MVCFFVHGVGCHNKKRDESADFHLFLIYGNACIMLSKGLCEPLQTGEDTC